MGKWLRTERGRKIAMLTIAPTILLLVLIVLWHIFGNADHRIVMQHHHSHTAKQGILMSCMLAFWHFTGISQSTWSFFASSTFLTVKCDQWII